MAIVLIVHIQDKDVVKVKKSITFSIFHDGNPQDK